MRTRNPLLPPAARIFVLAFVVVCGAASADGEPRRMEFLGEAVLATDVSFQETEVGGLSGLAWDDKRGVFYALSDDPAARGPARFYTLQIDLADGRLDPDDAVVEAVTPLRKPDGSDFERLSLDPEGLALAPGVGLFVSSEGQVRDGVPPFLAELGLDGRVRSFLPLDPKYIPRSARFWRSASGVRHNQALESLTLSPDGAWLFAATENALLQDGPAATTRDRSPARILRYDAARRRSVAEYLYWTEAVARPADPEAGPIFEVAGLVELLATGDNTLLALERSYSSGVGNTIRLFRVDLSNASDVSSADSLAGRSDLRPAEKTLLLDLAELGIVLDNLEGMSFGPTLADGRRTLLLVSDDNFNSPPQKTQLLAFAWSDRPATVAEVQGSGHRSPLERNWVFGMPATVAAVAAEEEAGGSVWVADADGEPAGLRVKTHDLSGLTAGDRVAVFGRVVERGRPGQLTATELVGGRLTVVDRDGPAPAPVRLGGGGRSVPSGQIDDDGLRVFEPESDAVDFFESLEGRLVEIVDALVVGPGNRFGECVVLADGGRSSEPRTAIGGLLLAPFDRNPERIVISTRLLTEPCRADVGGRFSRPLRGAVDYDFGTYRVLLTEPLPDPGGGLAPAAPTDLRGDADHLAVATFNVENLAPDDEEKLEALARVLTGALGGPDVVALQEIQDASGARDDGTVDGAPTFLALIEAVAAAGGPRYDFRQIDPEDGADGGQPGANIRVGYLFDPRRVTVIDRTGEGDSVRVEAGPNGPRLTPNPGRVAPADPAFLADESRGYEPTRRPLALEIEFNGRPIFLINAHLKSKGGDDRAFGPRQPPLLVTEEQRSLQAARLRELSDQILERDPGAAVVVLGDLNDHEFRGPLDVLTSGALINLVERVAKPWRYTFNYLGNSQVLDHLLVSPALADGAAVEILHLHADYSVPRASDHDPILARLRVPPPATGGRDSKPPPGR